MEQCILAPPPRGKQPSPRNLREDQPIDAPRCALRERIRHDQRRHEHPRFVEELLRHQAPDDATTAALVERLVTAPDATGLSGAELAVGAGWTGLRSHPRPTGSVVVGGGPLPPWFDDVLEELHP